MERGLVGRPRVRERHPIAAGAVVGFAAGLAGAAATLVAFGNPTGGVVGAVGCGVAVGVLSEERLPTTLLYAAVADLLTSVAAFLLFLVAYLAAIASSAGVAAGPAVEFAAWYLSSVGRAAVPAAGVSAFIAVTAAVLAAVETRGERPRWE